MGERLIETCLDPPNIRFFKIVIWVQGIFEGHETGETWQCDQIHHSPFKKKLTYITWKLMLGSDDPFPFFKKSWISRIPFVRFRFFPCFFRCFLRSFRVTKIPTSQVGRAFLRKPGRHESGGPNSSEMGWMEASRGFSFSRWWGKKGPSLWLFTKGKLWWFSLNNLGWWIILGGGFKYVLFSPRKLGKQFGVETTNQFCFGIPHAWWHTTK